MENQTVIIDNGSGMVKAGFSGEDMPRAVFPSIVGRLIDMPASLSDFDKEYYIGYEAVERREELKLSYPISAGRVDSWEDMEKVYEHCFTNELKVSPSECRGVLLTEAPRNPKLNRERMVSLMFEAFEVQNVYVAIQAVMTLYSAGRTTGLVVDSGDGVTHTVPVFEGYSIPHAVEKMEIAGRVLTKFLAKLLLENNAESFTSPSELEIVKLIKEKACYVSQAYTEENKAALESQDYDLTYTLPDKRELNIFGNVRMTCPELLFDPSLNGMTCQSIQDLTWTSVQGSDVDVRRDLCKNIILSGGTTLYAGLSERLKNEIVDRAPQGSDIRVVASNDRKFAVWKGAATLATLSIFDASWITKEDYEEFGPSIVHRKNA